MIDCEVGAVNPAFACFDGPEGWRQYLPENRQHHPESYWRALAGKGEFAPFMKMTYHGTGWWKKSDILVWFEVLFNALRPDTVAAIRAAGYQLAKPVTTTPKPKSRKTGNTQHYQHRRKVNDLLKPKRIKTGGSNAV